MMVVELTDEEKFLAVKCKFLNRSMIRGPDYRVVLEKRPADAIRRMIASRRSHIKYAGMKEAYAKLRAGFSSFDEFIRFRGEFHELYKYQGYLVSSFVEAEAMIEGKSKAYVRRLLLLEAL